MLHKAIFNLQATNISIWLKSIGTDQFARVVYIFIFCAQLAGFIPARPLVQTSSDSRSVVDLQTPAPPSATLAT